MCSGLHQHEDHGPVIHQYIMSSHLMEINYNYMLIFIACFVIGIVLNMLHTIYRKVGSVILHYFRSEEGKAQ